MKIAVDYDGTCVFHSFPEYKGDVPHAEGVLKLLADAGHQLILYTMRSDNGDQECIIDAQDEGNIHPLGGDFLTEAVKWFNDRNIPLYGVQHDPSQGKWTTSPKCYAELYIDDAALGCPLIYPEDGGRPYVDWLEVYGQLCHRKIL